MGERGASHAHPLPRLPASLSALGRWPDGLPLALLLALAFLLRGPRVDILVAGAERVSPGFGERLDLLRRLAFQHGFIEEGRDRLALEESDLLLDRFLGGSVVAIWHGHR